MSSIIAAEKNRIRKLMLERRNRISTAEIYKRSRLIQLHVLNSQQFLNSGTLGVYFPKGTEVRTEEIIRKGIEIGKKVVLPRIESEEMEFYQLLGKSFQDENLITGKFGIKEPIRIGKPINKIDLLIVPGIAFDNQGSRIGSGQGYFDRYLLRTRVPFSLALGYKFQLVSCNLPQSSLDQKINGLSMETGMLVF
ncbi:MAG TPA: 5-formyltetrahydrofolate cyclo-ligase [Nitrososphaeraceae archaeon]|nr:5-formyltetrahydrofolate cyclo-ligase [Nitrososphaeraceae archaeon]